MLDEIVGRRPYVAPPSLVDMVRSLRFVEEFRPK